MRSGKEEPVPSSTTTMWRRPAACTLRSDERATEVGEGTSPTATESRALRLPAIRNATPRNGRARGLAPRCKSQSPANRESAAGHYEQTSATGDGGRPSRNERVRQ